LKYNYINLSIPLNALMLIAIVNSLIISTNDLVYVQTPIYNLIIKDDTTSCIAFIILILTGLIILFNSTYPNRVDSQKMELPILIFASTTSIIFLITTQEIITFYSILELQSIITYKKIVLEATIKYFILSSISSFFLLLGFSFIYATTGTTVFEDLSKLVLNILDNKLYIGYTFILIGFFFKLYVAPLHFWAVDIYFSQPLSTLMYITTTSSIVYLYLLIKFYFIFFNTNIQLWNMLISIAIVLSGVIGITGAVCQRSFKKLLAYSTITNNSFLFSAFLEQSNSIFQNGINYIILYNIATLSAIMLLTTIKETNKPIDSISHLKGLWTKNVFTSCCIVLALYTLIGMPPFSYFFAKIAIINSMIYSSYLFLTVLLIIIAVLGAFYYINIIKNISYDKLISKRITIRVSYVQSIVVFLVLMCLIPYAIIYTQLNAITYTIALQIIQ
jgi:NADH-quinone oxidoreductase subunit N